MFVLVRQPRQTDLVLTSLVVKHLPVRVALKWNLKGGSCVLAQT